MSPMSRSDARKRNTNPRDQEHDMATDYRKAAQSLLDGELVGHVDLDTMASAAVHALLAIHDLLAEHIPQPDLAVAAEPAADTNGGIDHNPEPADITEEPPIGTQVTDRDGDVWYHVDDGWQVCDEDGLSGGSDLWPEVRAYAPLRLTTDEGGGDPEVKDRLCAEARRGATPSDDLGHDEQTEQTATLHAIRDMLNRLDGTTRTAVKAISGLSDDEVDDLGGLPDDEEARQDEGCGELAIGTGDPCLRSSGHEGGCSERGDAEVRQEKCRTCDGMGSTYNGPCDPCAGSGNGARTEARQDDDEALAKVLCDARYPFDPEAPLGVGSGSWFEVARTAREHIASEPTTPVLAEGDASFWRHRAERAEANEERLTEERDEWQARHAALREDVEGVVAHFEEHPTAGVHPRHVARRIEWNVLDRDDERGDHINEGSTP